MIGYFCLSLALLLSAYGNIVLKHHMSRGGVNLLSGNDFVGFLFHFFFFTGWGWSCIVSVSLCCFLWFAALSRFELSYIAPLLSANFVLVTILSIIFLNEAFTWNKIIGVCIIAIGIIVLSR